MKDIELRHFLAVYEQRGFTKAARLLDTPQSNVSTRIRNLEKKLGVRLFERRYRAVIPTESGERLYGTAKHVIATIDTAERDIRPPQLIGPF